MAGAARDSVEDVTMPSFTYSNAGLAELIVTAWANAPWPNPAAPRFGDALRDRDPVTNLPTPLAVATATNAVNALAGLSLKRAVVITEAEHDDDYVMQDPDEVVFVLPNASRQPQPAAGAPPPTPAELLETAKLLMACTPNGI
jgi:hypothetical protein